MYKVVFAIHHIKENMQGFTVTVESDDIATAKEIGFREIERHCVLYLIDRDVYVEMRVFERENYVDGDSGYFVIKNGKLVSVEW